MLAEPAWTKLTEFISSSLVVVFFSGHAEEVDSCDGGVGISGAAFENQTDTFLHLFLFR